MIGLYTTGTTLATGVTAGTITATTTGSVTAVAQSAATTATLKVFDAAGNVATSTQSVFLGKDTADASGLAGTANADFIFGFGGSDVISGGAGSDVIIGGAGTDTIDGGADNDRYDYTTDLDAGESTIVITDIAGDSFTVQAGGSADTISVAGFDKIIVTVGDTLYLGSASNATLDDMLGNTNDATSVTLAGNGNVGYVLGTLSGTTFTVGTSSTAMLVAWDGNAGDTTPENFVILTGVTFGTPTLAVGVLTIV